MARIKVSRRVVEKLEEISSYIGKDRDETLRDAINNYISIFANAISDGDMEELSLPEDLREKLEELSIRTGISEDRLIENALRIYHEVRCPMKRRRRGRIKEKWVVIRI